MKITLHTILGLKQVIGQKQVELDIPSGSMLKDLVEIMKTKWGDKLTCQLLDPASGSILPHFRVMINGQTIQFLRGMETQLKEGDEVLILPMISGG